MYRYFMTCIRVLCLWIDQKRQKKANYSLHVWGVTITPKSVLNVPRITVMCAFSVSLSNSYKHIEFELFSIFLKWIFLDVMYVTVLQGCIVFIMFLYLYVLGVWWRVIFDG